jgi:hypothetical protein
MQTPRVTCPSSWRRTSLSPSESANIATRMGAGAAKPLPAMAAPLPSRQSCCGTVRDSGASVAEECGNWLSPPSWGRRNARSNQPLSSFRSTPAGRSAATGAFARERGTDRGGRSRQANCEEHRLPGAAEHERASTFPEPRRSQRVVSRNALQSLVRLLGDALASRARARGHPESPPGSSGPGSPAVDRELADQVLPEQV